MVLPDDLIEYTSHVFVCVWVLLNLNDIPLFWQASVPEPLFSGFDFFLDFFDRLATVVLGIQVLQCQMGFLIFPRFMLTTLFFTSRSPGACLKNTKAERDRITKSIHG